MGCCNSRTAADDGSPSYPPVSPNQAADSSRNITATSPPQSAPISPRGSQSHTHPIPHASLDPTPSRGTRPNLPLKPINPSLRSKLPATLVPSPTVGSHRTQQSDTTHGYATQWTRAQLSKERNDWWDTRTTGNPEIWSALRLMVESLQLGDVSEAQALLDATECTCPHGWIWRGVFDGRGEYYRVPEWVVVEPEGIIDDEYVQGGANVGEVGGDKEIEAGAGPGSGVEEELGEAVKVRCRLSSNAKDYTVKIRRGEKVTSLIQNLKGKAGINPFASVRIVYGGRILDENQPLESHPYWNYDSRHVLIAMVFE